MSEASDPRRFSRLILARHGQTDYNVEGRLQGQIDIPLNEAGHGQARTLADALAGTRIDAIVASPLGRAMDTARAVASRHDLEVGSDPAYLERGFGQWEGMVDDEIRAQWPEQWKAWKGHDSLPSLGIEERSAVAERFARAARALLEQHPGQTVLVVSHGAAVRAAVTGLIGLDIERFPGIGGLGNCHRSELAYERSDGLWHTMRLLSHNVPPDFA